MLGSGFPYGDSRSHSSGCGHQTAGTTLSFEPPPLLERGGAEPADEGSGLGLYVSRELCRAMDGDLVLESAVSGRGAAFAIVLPGEPGEE